jgi:hypothetical protein
VINARLDLSIGVAVQTRIAFLKVRLVRVVVSHRAVQAFCGAFSGAVQDHARAAITNL